MEHEKAVALIALLWLITSLVLMGRSIRKGRALADALAARDPVRYEALGRPHPGYLASVRKARFARFVGRREFENLDDEWLSAQFEAYRKSEARLVVSMIITGAFVAALASLIHHATQ